MSYKFSLDYAWKQDLPNQIFTSILLLIIYPFVPKKYRKHFIMFFAIPAFIGSLFPDIAYFFLFLLTGKSGVNIYELSHAPVLGLILVPFSQLVIYLMNRFLTHEDHMPEYWYVVVTIVSLIFSWFHLIIDKLGY